MGGERDTWPDQICRPEAAGLRDFDEDEEPDTQTTIAALLEARRDFHTAGDRLVALCLEYVGRGQK